MRILVLVFLLLATVQIATVTSHDAIDRSVVAVDADVDCWWPLHPWAEHWLEPRSGTGVVLTDHRILTGANVVANAVNVRVRRADRPDTFTARVLSVARDVDLALLTVDDTTFFDGLDARPLAPLPRVGSRVDACTFGESHVKPRRDRVRISGIDMSYVGTSSLPVPLLEDDYGLLGHDASCAALFDRGGLVGMSVLAAHDDGELPLWHTIASPVVRQFLDDVADGTRDGMPVLPLDLQQTTHPALRAALGAPAGLQGARVCSCGESLGDVVREGDLLTRIDGLAVDAYGSVDAPGVGLVDWRWAVQRHQLGDEIELEIVRRGVPRTVRVRLRDTAPTRIPFPMWNEDAAPTPPAYAFVGSWVFTDLTPEMYFGRSCIVDPLWPSPVRWTAARLAAQTVAWLPSRVYLSRAVGDDLSRGYPNGVVVSVQGRTVETMRDVAEILATAAPSAGDTLEIRVVRDDGAEELILVPNEGVKASWERVARRLGLEAPVTPDVQRWMAEARARAAAGGPAEAALARRRP